MALPALPVIPLPDPADPAADRPPRSNARRALLAGPEGSARKEAARWLSSSGFEVVLAEDAAGALDLAGRSRPDVVLADMALRDERGRTLCQAIRQQARLLPMIQAQEPAQIIRLIGF